MGDSLISNEICRDKVSLWPKKTANFLSLFDLWKANGKSLRTHRYQDLLSMNGGKSDSESRGADVRMHTTCEKVSSLQSSNRCQCPWQLSRVCMGDCFFVRLVQPLWKVSQGWLWCGEFWTEHTPIVRNVWWLTVVESGSWIDLFGKVKNAPPFCLVLWYEVGATFEFESKVMDDFQHQFETGSCSIWRLLFTTSKLGSQCFQFFSSCLPG